MIPMNTHLQGDLDFRGVLDLSFEFIVHIWHDVHNGSEYILRSIPCQTYVVSIASTDLVHMCPNLWCNISKNNFLLGICFCGFDFSFGLTENKYFLCAMYGNVTLLFPLSLKKTVKNPFIKRQVHPELNNVIMEIYQSHKSGANTTLYNAAMKGFTLLSCILFELTLSISLWQNNHLQLQYIYLLPPMSLV